MLDEELAELSHKNFSPNTMKQIRWVRKMYQDWRAHRHSCGLEFIVCDLEEKATITVESLKFALCRFIMEMVAFSSTWECLGFAFKVINDPAFKDLKFTLDNTMKARVSQGIGISVCKANMITATDEDLLRSLGLLGMSHLEQLLNTVIFFVGTRALPWHAGKEHTALHGLPFHSQFKFIQDSDGEIFLQYMEDIGLKTNKGGLKHRKIEAKTVDLYATANKERCPL